MDFLLRVFLLGYLNIGDLMGLVISKWGLWFRYDGNEDSPWIIFVSRKGLWCRRSGDIVPYSFSCVNLFVWDGLLTFLSLNLHMLQNLPIGLLHKKNNRTAIGYMEGAETGNSWIHYLESDFLRDVSDEEFTHLVQSTIEKNIQGGWV